MPRDHDREHTHRAATGALVRTDRPAAPHLPPASASQVERRTHVDERTHAKAYYARDGQGREVYATYYNSNDDPTFQARYNNHNGQRTFMTTSSFTCVSNGGSNTRNPQRMPAAVIEEEDEPEVPDVDTRRHFYTRAAQPAAQPIVEEPDDDGNDNDTEYAYMDSVRRSRDAPDLLSPYHQHHHRQQQQQQPSRHYRDDTDMYQLSPFGPSNMLMHDFFMDDFLGGPRSLFGGMDAMRQHMSRQRAAMFGGVDPFVNFF
ncbi:hypothetical protein ABB37_09012 [Leptomonas pyrrhocoris]|uniref:Uncharacterized protein n=1 Tax=Leptomonas pyrrhocoris TaxID=157538 RepID=A0A0N0DRI2_LEPPY|nr:hypothetical protein ABB37_09012 [Leptomonas pyrrhocoris]XP_015653127.1 hypothetical protein ABB37_09012 [Leptomonas pyrrhocoris]KPA74687.1 hypothetical protein ABB37_09012 [Leptomonas pyrrhocoris]KPA74688.1 hypothetical protein ABB37_09012 [Leptomonas pyrrhocoris]|eukprot:XP_015653126.1 hypothetical protein ABB37_09012 [Leptomonas pyrrhocoris]